MEYSVERVKVKNAQKEKGEGKIERGRGEKKKVCSVDRVKMGELRGKEKREKREEDEWGKQLKNLLRIARRSLLFSFSTHPFFSSSLFPLLSLTFLPFPPSLPSFLFFLPLDISFDNNQNELNVQIEMTINNNK